MRIHVHTANRDGNGQLLDAAGFAERARMVEAAGLDGIWQGDHLPIAGDLRRNHAEPFITLALAAAATERIEVGTAIYCVPLRNAADVAMHLQTIETYTPGRFTFGVGTGSSSLEYAIAGLDWDRRYERLHAHIAQIRSIFSGEPEPEVEALIEELPNQVTRGGQTRSEMVGMPRMMLGSWFSGPQLRRAATEFDGWIASAVGPTIFRGEGWGVVRESMKRFRDIGGTRALFSTIRTDFRAASTRLADDGVFDLLCGPEEAAERLHLIEEIGFDDVVLTLVDSTHSTGWTSDVDYRLDDLEQCRALLPRDERDYRRSP